ncbi:hypothetical protein [Deinococcus roseus]|uniref:Uncharacterized protein n=1 Tax=Deinococcus roseus TaxID=392414 RepID=A0ABQ2D3I9_9DEIO|nr:hypothetical protein [Deinococcus roseus]GGJ44646.1 hypothetical protein GCM10008938_33530 [Deinococcus roseus]
MSFEFLLRHEKPLTLALMGSQMGEVCYEVSLLGLNICITDHLHQVRVEVHNSCHQRLLLTCVGCTPREILHGLRQVLAEQEVLPNQSVSEFIAVRLQAHFEVRVESGRALWWQVIALQGYSEGADTDVPITPTFSTLGALEAHCLQFFPRYMFDVMDLEKQQFRGYFWWESIRDTPTEPFNPARLVKLNAQEDLQHLRQGFLPIPLAQKLLQHTVTEKQAWDAALDFALAHNLDVVQVAHQVSLRCLLKHRQVERQQTLASCPTLPLKG